MSEAAATTSIARELFLRAMLVRSAPGEALTRIAEMMRDLRAAPGDVLFRAGEQADAVYFLVDGEIRMDAAIAAPGEEANGAPVPPSWTFGPSSIVGSLDVMAERLRARNAVVVKDSTLLRLRAEDWFDILEESFELTRSMVLGMARNVYDAQLALAVDVPYALRSASPLARTRPRVALDFVERMLVLRETPLLARAGVQVVASLASLASELRAGEGASLFSPTPASSGAASLSGPLQVVAEGLVELTVTSPATGKVVRSRFGPGQLVGGPGAFDGRLVEVGAHARALTPAVVLRIAHEDLFDQMEEHFELARSTLAYLVLERERLLDSGARAPSVPAPR